MKGFEPSLLEKLYDDAPREPGNGLQKRLSLEQFKESVALDVEALLNSRFVMDEDVLKAFPHCQRSLATYGLNDFAGRSLASSPDRAFICESLERAINRHEPRLTQVRVSLDDNQRSTGGMRFSISAMLVVHPAREPVNFDALLQPTTLQYSVSKARRPVAA
jgi:type VI secretion system protein ImpF